MVQGIKWSLKGKQKPRYQSFVHSTAENNFAATRLFFVALIKGKTGTALLKTRRANRSKGYGKYASCSCYILSITWRPPAALFLKWLLVFMEYLRNMIANMMTPLRRGMGKGSDFARIFAPKMKSSQFVFSSSFCSKIAPDSEISSEKLRCLYFHSIILLNC